ncbi:ATP-binding cassette domain-containing protein [Niabella drilacis]|uniref:Molybdate transport system ATP-binding protein n=1 Tax=Niabella drilacis (strain DSM 25811 / CCM 8410 / CCUG 62505 / LMG 26954 / E90) TaxID=1285928 RepID=A0A1G6SYT8_NIADE|nr:ATP-binding cassette domain-containing protein [Niabella drilacis]SDD21968.1 molybdate transport system ATP-binding protein [Niabella drilacis]
MSLVNIKDLSVCYGAKTVLHNISLVVNPGEGWVIRGESGSGKTTLGRTIAGSVRHSGDVTIHFNTQSPLPATTLFVESWYRFTNLEGDRNFYYQQRYNHQQRRDTVTIARELELFGKEHALNNVRLQELIATLDYTRVLDEQLFEISSGEHKKLQLIKALWLHPQLLIIDQPYTGLDVKSRGRLNELLNAYTGNGGTLILISNDTELPACVNRFAMLKDGRLSTDETAFRFEEKVLKPLPHFLKEPPQYTTQTLIHMKDIHVRYDDKQVLSNIQWQVNAGDRWLLQGHNGSGKSTLLSLITGDHPQAYANDIKLFGVQRGGGESIWDIKRRIGLISPELHWYFDANATVLQSLASGFFDSNGLYRQLRYMQKQQLDELLKFLDLYDVKNELLTTLPLGKQRLALLGRTIIKNPQLLVLDEPCQGLDQQQTQYFNKLVDEISRNGVTIIYVGHFETQLPACITHKLVLENGRSIENNRIATQSR